MTSWGRWLCGSALVGLIGWVAEAGAGTPRAAGKAAAQGEALGPGVSIDWDGGTVEAAGSAAADLRAPSAEVARIKAERTAKERARERMKKALLELPRGRWAKAAAAAPQGKDGKDDQDAGAKEGEAGDRPDEASLDAALAQAEIVGLERGSNGSVSLRLRLKLGALPALPLPPRHRHGKTAHEPAEGGAK